MAACWQLPGAGCRRAPAVLIDRVAAADLRRRQREHEPSSSWVTESGSGSSSNAAPYDGQNHSAILRHQPEEHAGEIRDACQ